MGKEVTGAIPGVGPETKVTWLKLKNESGLDSTKLAAPVARRVVVVIPGEATGPSMIFCKRQVKAIKALGATVEVFFLASRTAPALIAAEARRLRRVIRDFKPELLHAQFGTATAAFCVLVSPCPVVITYYGSDLLRSKGDSWMRSAAGRFLSQLAALGAREIISVSAELRSRLWWRQDRCVVIPTGVDIDVFRPIPIATARGDLGWDQEARVVLFNAGRDPVRKRIDLARAAVEEAQELLGPIQFEVMQGQTDPGAVPRLMNAANCLLVTSDIEGSPTVVQEALACNLPIVSVDVGDTTERLAGVEHCAIVDRDPVALGRALAAILRDRPRSNGRQFIEEVSTNAVGRKILTVYDRACRSNGLR